MVGAKGVLAALALSPAFVSAGALAQNGYSFSDAANSAVHYGTAPATPVMTCANAVNLATAETTIVSARIVPAADGVPEHCRVNGLIQPEIRFEVNLPANWNRRFYMHGNGGFAGEAPEIRRAADGAGQCAEAGLCHRPDQHRPRRRRPSRSPASPSSYQKRVDYAFRAVHMTAVEAKRIAAAYYGRAAAYSYWDGCSTGGRQGLISAQRFPHDFDGIVAGAPVLNFVDTVTQSLLNGLALAETPVPVAKMKLVVRSRLRALRRQGRAEGWPDRRSEALRLRSGARRGAMRGRPGRRDLPDAGADRGDQEDLCRRAGRRKARAFRPGRSAPRPPAPRSPARGPTDSGWATWLIPPADGKALQHAYGDSFVRYFLAKPDPATAMRRSSTSPGTSANTPMPARS